MDKFYIKTWFIVILLLPTWLFSQPCSYNNSLYLTWSAPTTVGDSVHSSCTYGGEYNRVTNMTAGNIYRISTCSDNSFDTEITIYTAGGGQTVAYNDDWCGLQSEMYFSPLSSGDYDILIDEYPCASNSICMDLTVELVYTPRPVITIPTVFHVVYNNSTENISTTQIQSQLNVLNEDLRRLNSDISTVPAVFRGRSADPIIEFCLAERDPQGNPTDGITRTYTVKDSFDIINGDTSIWHSNAGGKDVWSPDKYFNIWVGDLGCCLGGVGTPPGFAQNVPGMSDGVVINYIAFGTTGTAQSPFDGGRTTTHEVGHWLNLWHTFRLPGNCASQDSVFDTPPQDAASSGCPSFPDYDGCSGSYPGIMFMNFMDYSVDACRSLFTVGQFVRTEGAIQNPRQSIQNSNGCQTVVTCGGTTNLTAQSGFFDDGSDTTNYMFNADCKWLIQPTGANSITLSFINFDTESSFDEVKIYDGTTTSDPLLATYSGSSIPPSVTSTGGDMLVHFQSDGSISYDGWEAKYCSEPFANAGSDVSICPGESTTLSVSGGSSYNWSPGTGLSCTNCQSPSASPNSTTTYTVTATDANGCQDTDDVTVTVKSKPTANAGADVEICQGESTTLNATGGNSYSWSPSTGLSCTNCQSPTASPNSTTTYTVTVTGANGCQDSDNVTVTVNSNPTANAGSDVQICEGESTTLNASGGSSYSWNPGTGLSCTNCQSPSASPSSTTTYTVTVTDANGCQDSDDVTVTVNNCTGIEKIQGISSLKVFPNPNSGEFKIEFSSVEKQRMEIKLLDVTGRIVFEDKLQDYQGKYVKTIHLRPLSKGVYNLQIHTEEGAINKRIVFQ